MISQTKIQNLETKYKHSNINSEGEQAARAKSRVNRLRIRDKFLKKKPVEMCDKYDVAIEEVAKKVMQKFNEPELIIDKMAIL